MWLLTNAVKFSQFLTVYLFLGIFSSFLVSISNFSIIGNSLLHYYFIIFGCHLLEACSFVRRDTKVVNQNGRGSEEELGGVEGAETI